MLYGPKNRQIDVSNILDADFILSFQKIAYPLINLGMYEYIPYTLNIWPYFRN